MSAFVDKVKKFVLLHRMIEPGDRVLVAVSGGADSVALFHCLHQLKDELRFSLCIAHLNHMARGEESDEDARFVSRLGESSGVEVFVASIDARKESGCLKTSFQEGARILRYRYLESILKKWGGHKIAVGHNSDDNAETVLINLFRGSGMTGLAGIPRVHGKIIRPLLFCSRVEIESYLTRRQLSFRCDRTNMETDYLRNKIRLELIPKLEAEFSGNIKSHILNTAEIIRGEDDYLDSLILQGGFIEKNGGGCSLRYEGTRQLHPAMRRRVVRRAIAEVSGNLRRISIRHVDDVLKLIADPRPGKQIHLPGFLVISCKERELVFNIKPKQASGIINAGDFAVDAPIELKIPGITEIPIAGLKLHSRVFSGRDHGSASACTSYLDYEKTGENIHVRFFRPGDRFIPFGMTGRKKLKAFFIDEKVPRDKRKTIPLLTTNRGDIIWVYGMRIAHHYRVTHETQNTLCIEGIPDN